MRRSALAGMFAVAVVVASVLRADPCRPVCQCCPCQVTPQPATEPACHANPTTSSNHSGQKCPDCLRADSALPVGSRTANANQQAPDTAVGVLPPSVPVGEPPTGLASEPSSPPRKVFLFSLAAGPRAPPLSPLTAT